jgi:hypothetical protein
MGLTKSLYADLSCEEVFELECHCDELREDAIVAQDKAVEAVEADNECACDICAS